MLENIAQQTSPHDVDFGTIPSKINRHDFQATVDLYSENFITLLRAFLCNLANKQTDATETIPHRLSPVVTALNTIKHKSSNYRRCDFRNMINNRNVTFYCIYYNMLSSLCYSFVSYNCINFAEEQRPYNLGYRMFPTLIKSRFG